MGSVPSARIASICSVTFIDPSSLAMPEELRPATISAVSTGPSSRTSVRDTRVPVLPICPYVESARDICRDVFLNNLDSVVADERLMVASYFGGLSIAYSQVGVCHALSYGLSYVLGVRHGVGNCIVFNQLDEYYGQDVREFQQMIRKNRIDLPAAVTKGIDEAGILPAMNVWVRLTTRRRCAGAAGAPPRCPAGEAVRRRGAT